jgi:hypothetical protein
MAKKLDPLLIEILNRYGEDPNQALWDCHGTWVAYHKAIERIAAKAEIVFEKPEMIVNDYAAKTVVVCVTGRMAVKDYGPRTEWSFGEVSPANNKNAYPYAMAEKRAKDRVVLKLVGLHGLVYSEEESDDFKVNQVPRQNAPKEEAFNHEGMEHQEGDPPAKSSAQLKRDNAFDEFQQELWQVSSLPELEKFKAVWRDKIRKDGWPAAWKHAAKQELENREYDIMNAMDAAELAKQPLPKTLKNSLKNRSTIEAG